MTYPCDDYKPGDDDLKSFDFIRKFELDVNNIRIELLMEFRDLNYF